MSLLSLANQQKASARRMWLTLIGVVAFIGSCAKVSYAGGHDFADHVVYSGAIYGVSALVINSPIEGREIDQPLPEWALKEGYSLRYDHLYTRRKPDWILPALITLGLGALKEFALDAKPDGMDMVGDALGCAGAWATFEICW